MVVCASWPTTTRGCNDKKDSGMLGCFFSLCVCVSELVEQTSSVIFPIRFEFRISILFLSRNDTSMDVCVHVCVML